MSSKNKFCFGTASALILGMEETVDVRTKQCPTTGALLDMKGIRVHVQSFRLPHVDSSPVEASDCSQFAPSAVHVVMCHSGVAERVHQRPLDAVGAKKRRA